MLSAGWNPAQGRGTGSKDCLEWVSKDDQDVIKNRTKPFQVKIQEHR